MCLALTVILVPPRAYADLPRGTEIRAFLNDSCIVSDEPYLLPEENGDQVNKSLSLSAAVVGKVAQALIRGFIRATSAQLGSMAKQRDMYYVAARDFELYSATFAESPGYELSDKLACATIVAASFEPDSVDCTADYKPRFLPSVEPGSNDVATAAGREDDSIENVLRRANICVSGEARSTFEVRFEFSNDRTAYRLESAGLWINSLLSTKSKRATRGIVYTMDIAEPTADSDMRVLSSAWVNIGRVSAGYRSDGPSYSSRSEWLSVPVMSRRARNAYQADTSIHQDVYGEIEALQRSVTRTKRQHESMGRRMLTASDSIKGAIQGEMDSLELRVLRSESLLDARRAEYDDLPRVTKKYMPVTLRFGVIESRTEKRAMATLSKYLKNNSSRIATAAAEQAGFERSFDIDDVSEPDESETLEQARTEYYDALVAYEELSDKGVAPVDEDERGLAEALENFNEARAAAGIAPIQQDISK